MLASCHETHMHEIMFTPKIAKIDDAHTPDWMDVGLPQERMHAYVFCLGEVEC